MATVTQMSRSFGCSRTRLGTEQWVCGPGDVMVNPGGPQEHEAWFHKDTSGLNRTALIRIFDTNLAKEPLPDLADSVAKVFFG
jgi:hypothetical protein